MVIAKWFKVKCFLCGGVAEVSRTTNGPIYHAHSRMGDGVIKMCAGGDIPMTKLAYWGIANKHWQEYSTQVSK